MDKMALRGKRSRQAWGQVESEEEPLSDSQDVVELEADCSSDDDSRRGRCAISWKGSLEARFLKALQQAGGVWEAKPKAILQKMGAYSTQLTTIQVKSHLQKHRIKVAAEMQRQAAASGGEALPPSLPAPSATAPLQQARQAAQLQQAAARQAAAAAAAAAAPKPRRRPQKQSAGSQAELGPSAPSSAARKLQQQQAQAQRRRLAAPARPPSAAGPSTPQKLPFEGGAAMPLRHSAPAVLVDTASSGHQLSPVSGGSSSSGGVEHSRSHYSHGGVHHDP
ncbi:hypothetical protein CHLNCDRAFT_134070 [Chlorella variabilis]|uniref:HTH myb-type domain-containing protein n=1 Tax=Chlorella variabilis TaxID=554065 RepID=E1ZEX8_CHLVA|nr:hypothetical protein CHLNCDRAFT_134070 [Chlorella variabilis]EFN55736.1 hypothetical protein CHLNCDRAFT_134070 [Chlorella variabilis]|eukprot:XP_005847838.1 hypothetical protein CHLNCDRAFT_134070 [Chlorella variabilis]